MNRAAVPEDCLVQKHPLFHEANMFECLLYGTSKNKLRNKFYAVVSKRPNFRTKKLATVFSVQKRTGSIFSFMNHKIRVFRYKMET